MSENGATSQGNSNPFPRTGDDRRCIVCNRFLAPADVASCPTCKTDNSGWINPASPERTDLFPVAAWCAVFVAVVLHQWGYLLLRGGWSPSLAWGAALMESAPIGVASVVVAAIIYALRDLLRHYELKRKLKLGGWRPGLIVLAVFAVIIAIVVAVAVVSLTAVAATLAEAVEPADLTGSIAPVMPLASLPFLTIAIMLLGVNTYVRRLQSRFPPPIYCDTNQMCEVVLRTLGDSYLTLIPVKKLATHDEALRPDGKQSELKDRRNKDVGATTGEDRGAEKTGNESDGAATASTGSKQPETTPSKNERADTRNADEDALPILRAPTCFEVVSLRRNRTAGLDLIIKEHVTSWERQERAVEYAAKEEDPEYDVSTDEWAHITHFEQRKRKIRLAIYEPDVKTGR